MSYFKLQPNGLNYGTREYTGLVNLERILSRNEDRFFDYLNQGNRTLPNQNPLVKFLQSLSVNVEWDRDYLINQIHTRAKSIASLMDITSLYNKGKNHINSLYPESNHHTLLVLPFGDASPAQIDACFSKNLDELVPLYPIYTTDTLQRWDIMDLLDTRQLQAPGSIFTIINIDVYALVIGYWRWLKRGVDWGNSPHGYLANFPLANCYLYHNELVNFNYLNGQGELIDISKGNWNLENYYTQLTAYTDHKNRVMLGEPMQSFTEFYQINRRVNPHVDISKMIFPSAHKSLHFVQMSWVWSMASLGLVAKYLRYSNILGSVDGQIKAQLGMYFTKVQLQSQMNQIQDPVWKNHFSGLWNTVNNIRP